MASLTQEFDASPQTFIMTHSILVLGGGNPSQPNFQTGAGKFVLEDANTGPGTCFLRKASYIAWDYFKAFLLFASPNNDNVAALPNTVDRVVTDDLSGPASSTVPSARRGCLSVESEGCRGVPVGLYSHWFDAANYVRIIQCDDSVRAFPGSMRVNLPTSRAKPSAATVEMRL